MNKTILRRIQRLEEMVLLPEQEVSITKEFKNSEYYSLKIQKVLGSILKNCYKQLRQNPQSSIVIDIYKDKPCVIIRGSHYPESFNDGIENALEDNDLYTSDQRDTRVGYVIKISVY